MKSRALARFGVATAVALTLVLAVPSVEARPLQTKPTIGVTADWMNAATAWFGGLLNRLTGRVPTGKTPQAPAPTSTTSAIILESGGGSHTNSGSCIDPMGRPFCTY
jgi:hypothetical protein